MCLTTRMDYINQQDFLQLSLFYLQNVVNFKFESEVKMCLLKMCKNTPNLKCIMIYTASFNYVM